MIFSPYLTAYFFWLALALGCLSILMLHNLAGGYWGAVLRRPLEAAATTLPLLALLFIPLIVGMSALYPWVHGEFGGAELAASGATPLDLTFKQAYLSAPFFIGRAAAYFVIWIGLALLLVRWSRQRDANPSPALTARMRNTSAVGLVLMTLTVTFAGIDWLMSLDPAWTSSIWGLIVVTGALVAGFAFAVLVVALRANRPPFAEFTSPALFNSFGSLLLAFLMLWGYMSISQVILFYAGNLPEETIWYVQRTAGGWVLTALAIALLGFVIPFSLLILRPAKRNPRLLAAVCALLLVMKFINWYWLVQPTFDDNTLIAGALTAVLGVVIGAVWLLVFRWQYGKAPEISVVEPRLQAAREARAAEIAHHALLSGEQAHD